MSKIFRYKEDAKSKIGIKNECEICGFIPYTKNKYREKQDHLAKVKNLKNWIIKEKRRESKLKSKFFFCKIRFKF